MDLSSALSLAAFVGLNFATASSGAVFRPGEWYAALRKPGWTPPNWAFPVVWTTLFLMIAVSGWRVWEAQGLDALPALAVYALSLGLNAAWSLLFFGMRRMDWALAEVVVFWLSILAVIVVFAPIDALAAWLLAPYLAWVAIAASSTCACCS
jgi:tryptophan-rich sensory protein